MSNSFIDYDGYGNWSDGKRVFQYEDVIPSQIVRKKKGGTLDIPEWATHVAWYNQRSNSVKKGEA